MKRYIKSSYERPYLYIFKHGIGPGTIPKDVSVVKTKDLPNYYTAVWLDRFLTTSELKQYDIPSETRINELLSRIGYCQKNGDVVPCSDISASQTIQAYKGIDEPYGFDSKHFDQYDEEDWAYYIMVKLRLDEDDYYGLLSDINDLRADEWITDGSLNKLSKKALNAFESFIHSLDDEYGADDDVDACKDITASTINDDFEIGDIVEIYTSMDGWFGEYEVIREAEPEDYARLSQNYMQDYPGTKYLLKSTKPSFVGETIQTPQTMRKIHKVEACDNIMASASIRELAEGIYSYFKETGAETCNNPRMFEYLASKGYDVSDVKNSELDEAWDLQASWWDDEDEGPVVLSDGLEISDKEKAYTWLQENIEQYGNTYFWDSELKQDLNKLIERFGNTYSWRR